MPDGLVRTDGRWARILAALEVRPLSYGALVTQVRDRSYTGRVDRFKCKRAVNSMLGHGLIAGSHQRLQITDHGRMSFAHILKQEPVR